VPRQPLPSRAPSERDRAERPPAPRRRGWLLPAVRYALPGAVVLAGIIVMALGSETQLEGGAGIVGAGVSIVLVNLFFRIGSSGESEREAEDAAREHLERHGRWPS
jgi:hypothetical protein